MIVYVTRKRYLQLLSVQTDLVKRLAMKQLAHGAMYCSVEVMVPIMREHRDELRKIWHRKYHRDWMRKWRAANPRKQREANQKSLAKHVEVRKFVAKCKGAGVDISREEARRLLGHD